VVQLKRYNTLSISARAFQLINLSAGCNLTQLSAQLNAAKAVQVIGGGSNLVVRDQPEATVLRIASTGVKLITQSGDQVLIQAAAGENWHAFVMNCLKHGWYGLENLALIPGKVGASPIQNIGAYGLEAGEKIDSVQVWHWPSNRIQIWSAERCLFGYRDSVFKHGKGRNWIVLAVRFRLTIQPKLRLGYAELSRELDSTGLAPTPLGLAQAVMRVRQRKLPDPAKLPNAGSFFKNPVLSVEQFNDLKQQNPDLPQYPTANGIKTSAAWLIDQCGWKGKSIGDAAVHRDHALVLVNTGNATGQDIMRLAGRISGDVQMRFGIQLEPEPVIW
jgi:UDP-N-acetylmuramate dehydrogenase